MGEDLTPDPPAPASRRPARRPPAVLRVIAQGSVRSVDPPWGVNFGPESDVDQEIPGSGGLTLRRLKDAGEIRADCFSTSSDEE